MRRPPKKGEQRLVAAGAFVTSSSCDYCFGRMGVIRGRARCRRHINVRGGWVNREFEIYS